MSPRAEEGLLACLLRLPRLLPAEQRVALGHEAGDARLWVRWVWVYEVENGVVNMHHGSVVVKTPMGEEPMPHVFYSRPCRALAGHKSWPAVSLRVWDGTTL